MMDPEASRRPSAEQLLHHTWMMQHVSIPDLTWPVALPAPIATMPSSSPSAVYAKKEMMAPMSPTADTIPAYMPSNMSHGPSSGELHSLMKTPTGLESSEQPAWPLPCHLPPATCLPVPSSTHLASCSTGSTQPELHGLIPAC
jgi:hypothetical protein